MLGEECSRSGHQEHKGQVPGPLATSPCPEMRGSGFHSRRLQGNQRESRVGLRRADRCQEGFKCRCAHVGTADVQVRQQRRAQVSFIESQSHKLVLRGTSAET